jgi:hypothetical protein
LLFQGHVGFGDGAGWSRGETTTRLATAVRVRDNGDVQLTSVRELKRKLLEPLTSFGGLQPQNSLSISVPAERTRDVALVQPGIALGIAAGDQPGDYRLAVRVQHRDVLRGSKLAAITKAARNEVDVQYIGELRKQLAVSPTSSRKRPITPGVSLGHYDITAGTLGAFVRVDGDDRPRILSNNHVLADENRGAVGDEILQPGALDGGSSGNDRVATLERFVALDTTQINAVDAAIATLDPDVEFSDIIEGIGTIDGLIDPAEVEKVVKRGRTTGLTSGVVTAIEVDSVVVGFSTGTMRFDGQIEISGIDGTPFSSGGDSGSLVIDPASSRAVGLLFAGSDQGGPQGFGVTYANPIATVFTHLAIAGLW